MDYKGFQRFILVSGSLLIIASTGLVFITTRSIPETIGQLLFFLLLIGALYDGRRGGTVSAILASTIYATMHFTSILSQGIGPVLPLILIRSVIYCVTGPLGGEILSKIKQFMVEASHQEFVDPETKIFNRVYFARLAEVELSKFERYNTVSSIVIVTVDPEALALYLKAPRSPGIKYLTEAITGSVRLVDEVGRVDDGVFGVILPFTPDEGAKIVAKRLHLATSNRLGYEDSVDCEIISLPGDKERLEAMIREFAA